MTKKELRGKKTKQMKEMMRKDTNIKEKIVEDNRRTGGEEEDQRRRRRTGGGGGLHLLTVASPEALRRLRSEVEVMDLKEGLDSGSALVFLS